SDAAQGGSREAAAIFGELEVRLGLPGVVVGAEAEVFVDAIGADDFAWIHLPLRVPGVLEIAEGLDQLRAEHPGEQFGAGLAVAMLAGEGATETDDEIRGFLNEGAVIADAGSGFEVEVDAGVQT